MTGRLPSSDTGSVTESLHVSNYRKFISVFFSSHGAWQILVISTLYSIGIGSVLGLIPAILSDRYARINHGFTGHCRDYVTKPPECKAGSDDAQSAAVWSHVALSAFLLLANPIFSALSDMHGRKPVILGAVLLSCIPAAVFYQILVEPNMNPVWYYVAFSFTGSVNFLSTTFAALSDVIPPEYRAATYGFLLSGYFGGFSLAPTMAVVLSSDISVALFSLVFSFVAFFAAFCFLPETLPDEIRNENANLHRNRNSEMTGSIADVDNENVVSSSMNDYVPQFRDRIIWIWQSATRPLREIAILNRNRTLQLVSLGSFCAAMVFAIDTTLVIYYIEEKLDVQKADIAIMTLALGIAGILIQGGLVQPITATLGEKGALILAFACGILHNFLYGSARTKTTIYATLILSQLTKINIPLLSSLASREVDAHEQGRVQGALFAINAVGNAVGPVLVEFIYHHHSAAKLGPGSMFIYASVLYAIGTAVVSFVPDRPVDAQAPQIEEFLSREELEEPLLNSSEIVDDVDSRSAPVV